MAQLTGDTVKRMARDAFDYELSDDDADAMARTAGAMMTLSRHLAQLGTADLQPPFGYPMLVAQASHQRASKM